MPALSCLFIFYFASILVAVQACRHVPINHLANNNSLDGKIESQSLRQQNKLRNISNRFAQP